MTLKSPISVTMSPASINRFGLMGTSSVMAKVPISSWVKSSACPTGKRELRERINRKEW